MNIPIYELIKKTMVNEEIPRGFSLFNKQEEIAFVDGAIDGIRFYHMRPQTLSDDDYKTMTYAIIAVNQKALKLFQS